MKEAKPKRGYVRYTVQDKARFFDLKIEKRMTASALISRDDDRNEVEYDAFSTFECRPIIPSKRPLDTNAIEPSICNDLASLIYKSPHRRLLASRKYFELDDTAELLLNKGWLHEPQVKFACAQVLADAVLMNVSNGEAILVNTVEMYRGTKSVDIHRELPFSSSMSIFTIKPTYANIWPHIRSTGDGSKLPGPKRETKSGAIIVSFCYVTTAYENIHRSGQLDKGKKDRIKCVNMIHRTVQFDCPRRGNYVHSSHHPTTYYLCRASSDATLFSHLQSYIVFTYCDHEGSAKSMDNENASMIASRLFQRIAYSIIHSPSEAHLDKDFVASLHDKCKNNGKIKQLFRDLLHLFGDDMEMVIIGNSILNNQILQHMAAIMSSDISKANETVVFRIQKQLRAY
ncbi:hypothetical protein G6F60_012516 [Rhizopus arrhizus]|nr:hypothetical protein G6F66_012484 [Rhizopus arrhizus]KAG1383552.1 hypothetical protein G6F61_001249 [Rhizopus arrhizus]KAG1391542.1 hypothetical protein G6F60_012516 [Rhizopus arrhizus]